MLAEEKGVGVDFYFVISIKKPTPTPFLSNVARIKRSEIRGGGARTFPDCAAFNPGYGT
jgi:hypothetical protein